MILADGDFTHRRSLATLHRASVYRALGRAARAAREDRDQILAADLRRVIELLRSHARAPKRR